CNIQLQLVNHLLRVRNGLNLLAVLEQKIFNRLALSPVRRTRRFGNEQNVRAIDRSLNAAKSVRAYRANNRQHNNNPSASNQDTYIFTQIHSKLLSNVRTLTSYTRGEDDANEPES